MIGKYLLKINLRLTLLLTSIMIPIIWFLIVKYYKLTCEETKNKELICLMSLNLIKYNVIFFYLIKHLI